MPGVWLSPVKCDSPIVVPGTTPKTDVAGSWTVSQNSGFWFGTRCVSGGTQNNEVQWTVFTSPGTWSLTLCHTPGSDHGIYTVSIDGTAAASLGGSASTIDGYSAGSTPTTSTITGLVLSGGLHVVDFKMATKNASSTNYYGDISGFILTRTA